MTFAEKLVTHEVVATSETRLSRIAAEADDAQEAVPINDHVFVSKGMGDSVLITGSDANVAINAGFPEAGAKHRARFERVSSNPLAYLVLTQSHLNQYGGTYALKDPETRVIAQARYPECRQHWIALHTFYAKRSRKLWRGVLPDRTTAEVREVVPDITFDRSYSLEVGGRPIELHSTPGGESVDALIVWLPQDRLAVTGNLFGPIFGNLPNLYTIRGDKIRSAMRFVESLDLVRALTSETIITGHEVISGAASIDAALTRVRDAVLYIHEQTIAGMNAGRDVHSLMREIALPEKLRVAQGHGKTSWCVRAIWEEHAGWFHYDATTSLYAAPPATVAADLVELAGGTQPLAARAERYLDRSEPLQALHLIELALVAEPASKRLLEAKLRAHLQLLEQSGGETFSEVQWLESEIAATRRALES